MAFSRVQSANHQNGASSSTTVAVTLTSAVTSGNGVFVTIGWASTAGDTVSSVTDDKSNTYTVVDTSRAATTGFSYATAYLLNVTNAPQTITATLSASRTFSAITAVEESGFTSTGGLDAHAMQAQNNPGVGSNAVTSSNNTTTKNGDLIFGTTVNVNGTAAPGIGTGFTSRDNFSNTYITEDQVQSTAGAIAATFTAGNSGDGGNDWVTGVLSFKSASAFGDLKGTLSVGKTSVTATMAAVGSVAINVGDLIIGAYSELTSNTCTGVTDNLGNTYTAQNAGSAATAAGRAFYSIATTGGTLTAVNFACTASSDDSAVAAAVFEAGPNGFAASPLDASPSNTTGDTTSPFTCPATGTLAQTSELVIAWASVTRGQTNTAATSPNLLAKNQASTTANTASSVYAAIGYQVVSATTSISPAFTNASGTFNGSVLGTMSFKEGSAASPQTLTPSLYTNSNTFYTQTVSSSYPLTPSLFTDADTFYTPTITPGGVTITPSLYSDVDTFYSPTVTPGAINLTPSLFSDADTFFTPSVVNINNLAPDLFSDADTFFGPTIATGPVNIAPSLFSDTDTFYTATVSPGPINLTPSLFTDPDTFYTPTVSPGAVNLTPALFTSTNTFYVPTVSPGSVNIAPSLFSDPDTFFSPVLTGLYTLTPALFSDPDIFYTAVVAPGPINLTPALFADADTFYIPSVTSGAGQLFPALFTNTNTFFTPVVTPGAVHLTAPLLTDPDTFYSPSLTSLVTLLPSLFSDLDIFYTPAVTQSAPALQNLSPSLFLDDPVFFPFTVKVPFIFGPVRLMIPHLFNATLYPANTIFGRGIDFPPDFGYTAYMEGLNSLSAAAIAALAPPSWELYPNGAPPKVRSLA